MAEYRVIPGHPDYMASSDGIITDSRGNVLVQTDCHGYRSVVLRENGSSKAYRVHRLVALAFIPNEDNLPYVNHIDGHKDHNNVDNLEWCTPGDNVRHAVREGLIHKKFTKEQIDFVKGNTGSKTATEIASELGLHEVTAERLMADVASGKYKTTDERLEENRDKLFSAFKARGKSDEWCTSMFSLLKDFIHLSDEQKEAVLAYIDVINAKRELAKAQNELIEATVKFRSNTYSNMLEVKTND